MGICGTKAQNLTPEERAARQLEMQRSKDLDSEMTKALQKDQQINKLLLLGAGESGTNLNTLHNCFPVGLNFTE